MRSTPLLLAAVVCGCTVFDGVTLPDAGVDAGADAGPLPPGYLELEDAARLCRWVLECDRLAESIAASIAVPLSSTSFSSCVAWAAGPVPPSRPGIDVQRALLLSVAGAVSCDDALSRTFVEILDPAAAECAGMPGTSCADEATLLDCGGKRRFRCSSAWFSANSTCSTTTVSRCSTGSCTLPSASCESGVLELCDEGLAIGTRCETRGLDCGDLKCVPSPGLPLPCSLDELGDTGCGDGVIRVCDGLTRSTFSCADLPGGKCVVESGHARCQLPGEACSPFDGDQSECDGTQISVCVAGAKTSIDCAALGLACVPGDAERTARCSLP